MGPPWRTTTINNAPMTASSPTVFKEPRTNCLRILHGSRTYPASRARLDGCIIPVICVVYRERFGVAARYLVQRQHLAGGEQNCQRQDDMARSLGAISERTAEIDRRQESRDGALTVGA